MAITFPINGNGTLTEEPRVLAVQFGDGFKQTAPDGLHPITPRWQVVFDGLVKTEVTTLLAELRQAKGSGPVQWQSPLDSAALNYRVASWTTTALEGQIYSVACTLELIIEP